MIIDKKATFRKKIAKKQKRWTQSSSSCAPVGQGRTHSLAHGYMLMKYWYQVIDATLVCFYLNPWHPKGQRKETEVSRASALKYWLIDWWIDVEAISGSPQFAPDFARRVEAGEQILWFAIIHIAPGPKAHHHSVLHAVHTTACCCCCCCNIRRSSPPIDCCM